MTSLHIEMRLNQRSFAYMRQIRIILLSLLVIAAFTAFVLHRSSQLVPLASAAQPRPAPPTVASIVDCEISSIEQQILDVAEAMPEDKFNFSPEHLNIPGSEYKSVRSFTVQLKHVAASNYFIWSHLTG